MAKFNLCQTMLNHLFVSYTSVLYQNVKVKQGMKILLGQNKNIKIYSKELNKIEIKVRRK